MKKWLKLLFPRFLDSEKAIYLFDTPTVTCQAFFVSRSSHSFSQISHPNNETEMTQIACRIIEDYGTDHINYYRLVKLLYIIEHESWKRLSRPAMGGKYFSMEGGPMISETANATKPENADAFKIWSEHLKTTEFKGKRNAKQITLIKPAGRDDISDALLAIIDEVVNDTRHWTNKQIENHVHDVKIFKEYKKPKAGSNLPIEVVEILESVGKSPEKIKKLQAESAEWRMFDAALA